MKIKQLYVYPIKSLRGSSLPSLSATYQGFEHDRRFMLLRASDLKNMHVSDFPEMCLFTTEIVFPSSSSNDGKIIATFNPPSPNDFSPSQTSPSTLTVPLQPSTEGLEEVKVDMHYSPTTGSNMGERYNDWFSERFGYGVILVYLGKNRREVLGNMPPNVAGRQLREGNPPPPAQPTKSWMSSITSSLPSISFLNGNSDAFPGVDEGISFADCAPYLVISTKSWENAQNRLPEGEEMDISKFRPNIVVEGADEAFDEDFWAELEIDSPATSDGVADKENSSSLPQAKAAKARFVLTQNCARCNSLNVDYATGKVAKGEAGKILKALQSDRRVDPGAKYSPIFGRYGFLDRIVGDGALELNVGDEVRISRRNGGRTKFEWPNLSTN